MRARPLNVKPKSAIKLAHPFAFFNFHDAYNTRPAVTTLTTCKNNAASYDKQASPIALADLQYQGTIGTSWSSNPGEFVFPGTATNYFRKQMSQDDNWNLFSPIAGLIFVWARIYIAAAVNANLDLLQLGSGAVTGVPSLEFAVNCLTGVNRLQIDHIADNNPGAAVSVAGSNGVVNRDAYTNIAWVVDYREGQKLLNTYASGVFAGSGSLGTANSLTLKNPSTGWNAFQYATLGSRLTSGVTEGRRFDGRVQRVGIINYGKTPPNNLNAIITELHRNNGLPGWELNAG